MWPVQAIFESSMKFQSLAESPLSIPDEEMASLFEPFVSQTFSPDDPTWRREVTRRKKRILHRYVKQKLLGWLPSYQRNVGSINAEYSTSWLDSKYATYSLQEPPKHTSPWIWRDRQVFASPIGGKRFRQLMMIRTIELINPRNVLEVGCGDGLNLMLLACRFPDIEFAGVELTEYGHTAAKRFQELPELPAEMVEFAPLPLKDVTAFRKIRFVQGTAAELPFEDNSFDMVQTILALEQMERIRAAALSEIARVTRDTTLMIEPFRDVNENGWPRMNVVQRDYYRGRIADLHAYDLDPVMVINDFPQEMFLKVCAVQSKKRSA